MLRLIGVLGGRKRRLPLRDLPLRLSPADQNNQRGDCGAQKDGGNNHGCGEKRHRQTIQNGGQVGGILKGFSRYQLIDIVFVCRDSLIKNRPERPARFPVGQGADDIPGAASESQNRVVGGAISV